MKTCVIRLRQKPGESTPPVYLVSYDGKGNWEFGPWDRAFKFRLPDKGGTVEENTAVFAALINLEKAGKVAFAHPVDGDLLLDSVADNLPEPTTAYLKAHGAEAYIIALADSFRCLRDKTPVRGEWDVDRWVDACGPWSHAERSAAMFVALVWNYYDGTNKGWKFDAIDALSVWDFHCRQAFLNWAAKPVWP